jgi:hypothetical protein
VANEDNSHHDVSFKKKTIMGVIFILTYTARDDHDDDENVRTMTLIRAVQYLYN